MASRRYRRAAALRLLLAAVVASLGAASCSEGPASPSDNAAAGSGGTADPTTAELLAGLGGTPGQAVGCEDGSGPSLALGLEFGVGIDSIAFYSAETRDQCTMPDYELVSRSGVACASAEDAASCADEVERLANGSSDWAKHEDPWRTSWGLLVVTGSEENIAQLGGPFVGHWDGACGSDYRGGVSIDGGQGGAGGASGALSPNATKIADRATLLALLGHIDNRNEAALVMWAHNFDPPCTINLIDGEYVTVVNERIGDCPIYTQDFELRVGPDGAFTQTTLGSPVEGSSGDCQG